MNTFDELFRGGIKLPAMPAVAMRILEAIRKDDLSFPEMGRIIQSDPALAAKILGVANSSFYASQSKVETIERALSVLGLSTLKSISLSFAISSEMMRTTCESFDQNQFWRRSVTAAVAANMLAPLFRRQREDLFVTSLLQDIGVVVLAGAFPERYKEVLSEKRRTRQPIHEIERQTLGTDHCEVGAEILRRWNIPEPIWIPIRHHHDSESAPPEWRVLSEILFLSNRIASLYHGDFGSKRFNEVHEALGTRCGLPGQAITELIDGVATRTLEILQLFGVTKGDMVPLSRVLQEANEELSKINISHEMLVVEYRRAKQKAERLSLELAEATERLRELSVRDGLTGLLNHRRFQETLGDHFENARCNGKGFSMILLDLDQFKRINDQHGHLEGDRVLVGVAEAIRKVLREGEVVSRFGGEEFAILLPGKGLAAAVDVAERIREAVAALTLKVGDSVLQVTISAGVAVCDPAQLPDGKSAVIEEADRGLYRSKLHGRNQVTALRAASKRPA